MCAYTEQGVKPVSQWYRSTRSTMSVYCATNLAKLKSDSDTLLGGRAENILYFIKAAGYATGIYPACLHVYTSCTCAHYNINGVIADKLLTCLQYMLMGISG